MHCAAAVLLLLLSSSPFCGVPKDRTRLVRPEVAPMNAAVQLMQQQPSCCFLTQSSSCSLNLMNPLGSLNSLRVGPQEAVGV